MTRIFNIIISGFTVMAIEYFLLLFFFQIDNVIRYKIPLFSLSNSFKHATEVSLMRLLLYFFLWVVGIYLSWNKFRINNVVLKFAIINCLLYITISILMTLFFPFAIEFFTRSFFYYLVLATMLSPFIASLMPFFRKLILSVNKNRK